jgi:hypothetical protein
VETPAPLEAVDGIPITDLFLRDPELLKTFLQTYEKGGSGPLEAFFIPIAQPSFLPDLMKSVSPESDGEGRNWGE